jgi:ABC-2 type transport system permease protein
MSAALTFGQATRLVARREITERLRDKGFLVSTVITIAVLVVVMFMPKLFGSDDTFTVGFAGPSDTQLAAAADAQAKQAGLVLEHKVFPDEAAARTAVADGDLDAYVTADRIVVHEELDQQLGVILQTANAQVISAGKLQAKGIDPTTVAEAQQVPPLAVDATDPVDPKAAQRGQIAFIGSLILYGQIIGYCMWVAFGIVEEKVSRVVELILSAISTKALLAGKILGIGILGIAQLAVIAAVALVVGNATGAVELSADLLVPVGYVLMWFVLGYAFYSAVFAAGAARVSRQEELQNVTGPMTMVLLASFFATFYVNANPDALVSRILAVIPPFSALASPVRMARESAPWWELVLALVLMLAAIAALIVAGARIYEGAILRMGAKVSFRDAWLSGRGSKELTTAGR